MKDSAYRTAQKSRRSASKRKRSTQRRYAGRRSAKRGRSYGQRRKRAVRRVTVARTQLKTPFGTTIRTAASRAGVPSSIAAHLSMVAAQCGAVRIISAYRPGARIAGSGRMSCHAMGQAVDYQIGNPSCALRLASRWRGGHSIDYNTAPGGKHFHISICRQEMGVRFAHRGGRSYARSRYARNRSAKRYRGAKRYRVSYQHSAHRRRGRR